MTAVYRTRRAAGHSREGFAGATRLPMAALVEIESGGDPDSHAGYHLMRRVAEAVDGTTADHQGIQEHLHAHKERLDAAYLQDLIDRPEPFPGWADSGLPEFGLTLLDRREERNLSIARLARGIGRSKSDILRAEAGFADSGSDDGELAMALMHNLGFDDTGIERHASLVSVLRARSAAQPAMSVDTPVQHPEPEQPTANGEDREDAEDVAAPIDAAVVELDELAGSAPAVAPDTHIAVGHRQDFLWAPSTGHFRPWTAQSSLTIMCSALPPELGLNLDNFGPLEVCLRDGTVADLGRDPSASRQRLLKVLPEIESGRLILRVINEEEQRNLPHDLRIVHDHEGAGFVNARNEEVDVSHLLITESGAPLRASDGFPMTPGLYADELVERLRLQTSQRTSGDDLQYWQHKADELHRLIGSRRAPRRPITHPSLPGSPSTAGVAGPAPRKPGARKTPGNGPPR